MNNLYLFLKYKWYDSIESGQKTSEYREIKPYWINRLENKHYDTVTFQRGFTKNPPKMMFKILEIKKTTLPNDLKKAEVYEIKLGERIK